MDDERRLQLVRALHTAIYLAMSAAVLLIVAAGIFGVRGPWLWVALTMAAAEAVVFVGSGLKCPLTAVVAKYAHGAHVSDTFLPEGLTRHTLTVFGPLLVLGVALIVARGLASG